MVKDYEFVVNKNKCLHCDYEWVSRVSNPKVCPNCKSYNWSKKPKFRMSDFN